MSKKQLTEVEKRRRAFLMDFHIPVQKVAVTIVGPVSVAIFLAGAIAVPCWQNWVRLAAITGMALSWIVGYRYSRNKDLEVSVKIALSSILVFQSVELMMVTGTEAATLIGLLATTCYAALFSKRYLIATGIAVGAAVLASELVKFTHVYEVMVLPPTMRLINQLAFTALLYPLAIFILRKSQGINDQLFQSVSQSNKEQEEIIRSANRIQITVDDVTNRFKAVSTEFVAQASQQATTTAEVKQTVGQARTIATDTATLASATHASGQLTKDASLKARQELLQVEKGFESLSEMVLDASQTMDTLAEQAASIGDILNYNKSVGDRIKLLAVNAGIEAAKAGPHGAGFRVIAGELRGMIHTTNENLQESTQILLAIHSQAGDASELISESARKLNTYFRKLRTTGEEVARIIDNFVKISENVSQISGGALKQSTFFAEIDTAMEELKVAARGLEGSGEVLLEGLDNISTTHTELGEVLATRGPSMVPEE